MSKKSKRSNRLPINIGYARVSTEEQNLGLQIDALNESGCITIYDDAGISGAARDRPGLNAALSHLRPGDTLTVWRLDRLGRSLPYLIETIEHLNSQKIHFRSLTESIDPRSPSGLLVFHILAAMGQFERTLISERTRAGMRTARLMGKHIGRPTRITDKACHSILADLKNGELRRSVARRHGISVRTVDRLVRRQRCRSTTDC